MALIGLMDFYLEADKGAVFLGQKWLSVTTMAPSSPFGNNRHCYLNLRLWCLKSVAGVCWGIVIWSSYNLSTLQRFSTLYKTTGEDNQEICSIMLLICIFFLTTYLGNNKLLQMLTFKHSLVEGDIIN